MFVEEVVCHLINKPWLNGSPQKLSSVIVFDYLPTRKIFIPWTFEDAEFLYSLTEQLGNGNAFTEKQSYKCLGILEKYVTDIKEYIPNIAEILSNPTWKFPFRKLITNHSVWITNEDNKQFINVELPYDKITVDRIKTRNTEVDNLHRAAWNLETKTWKFPFTEINILFLSSLFSNFYYDKEFTKLSKAVKEIANSPELHVPMLVWKDDRFCFVNTHKKVPQPNSDNLSEVLLFSRKHGINIWSEEIEELIKLCDISPVITKLVTRKKSSPPWFDSTIHDLSIFTELLTIEDRILIVVPGGDELTLVSKWVEFANSIGIKNSDMSVYFRLASEQSNFNKYIKDNILNSPLTENTKLIFIGAKIPKPLIKSNLKFKTVINLGYYDYVHNTMVNTIETATNLVYYSMKEPTRNNAKWRRH